eukprot:s4020_g4.t1
MRPSLEAKSCAAGEEPAGAARPSLGLLTLPVTSPQSTSVNVLQPEMVGAVAEDPPAVGADAEDDDDSEDLEVGRRRSVRDVVSHFEKQVLTRSSASQLFVTLPPGTNTLERAVSPDPGDVGSGLDESRLSSGYCKQMPLPLSCQDPPSQLSAAERGGALDPGSATDFSDAFDAWARSHS